MRRNKIRAKVLRQSVLNWLKIVELSKHDRQKGVPGLCKRNCELQDTERQIRPALVRFFYPRSRDRVLAVAKKILEVKWTGGCEGSIRNP